MLQPRETNSPGLHDSPLVSPSSYPDVPLSSSPSDADAVTLSTQHFGLCFVLCWKHTVVVSSSTSDSPSSLR